jgi:hypothetical protein
MDRTHTYVECCDRYTLVERTVWDSSVEGRVCRDGMGCGMVLASEGGE